MIHLFNRKELTITYSMEMQAKIRSILAAAGIDYRIKTSSAPGFSAGSRSRSGSFGISADNACEYIFYVKRDDYDRAVLLIRS